jgi:ribonuclease BN (tRNA processing enzyme)
MKVTFLSANTYDDPSKNNGDCILVDNGTELVIFDCGCEEHAMRVVECMEANSYQKAKLVLSHNDADHFDGIPYLIEQGVLSEVYTLLLLKYKDELLDRINDKRRTRDSIAKSIEEIYSNIYSLSGEVTLKDIFTDTNVATGITIPGPDKEYSLEAVAKRIDGRESDDIDKETIVNAVSTQLSVDFGSGKKLLLTGDSNFKAIESTVKSHSAIQLPHHGKLSQAEEIFAVKDNATIYYVSDNTGDSNGGSNKLREKYPRARVIHNTINGDQTCTAESFKVTARVGTYFVGEQS